MLSLIDQESKILLQKKLSIVDDYVQHMVTQFYQSIQIEGLTLHMPTCEPSHHIYMYGDIFVSDDELPLMQSKITSSYLMKIEVSYAGETKSGFIKLDGFEFSINELLNYCQDPMSMQFALKANSSVGQPSIVADGIKKVFVNKFVSDIQSLLGDVQPFPHGKIVHIFAKMDEFINTRNVPTYQVSSDMNSSGNPIRNTLMFWKPASEESVSFDSVFSSFREALDVKSEIGSLVSDFQNQICISLLLHLDQNCKVGSFSTGIETVLSYLQKNAENDGVVEYFEESAGIAIFTKKDPHDYDQIVRKVYFSKQPNGKYKRTNANSNFTKRIEVARVLS